MRILYFLFLFLCFEGFGQNLISNPYFNEVKDCSRPTHLVEFESWFNITTGYRNIAVHNCLNNTPYGPYGTNLKKYPKKGLGMTTLEIYFDEGVNRRSYILNSLKSELQKKTTYYIRFYVSPMKHQNDTRNIVADAVGLHLSVNNPNKDIITILPYRPQIECHGQFFDDYDKWYKIQGKFKALGGEKYAIIGNFRSDEDTQYKYNNPSSQSVGNIAEIFIDDVLIEAFDPLPDTILLCDRQSLTLNAGFHDARYQWNTGDRDSIITVHRSGKYKITATIDTLEFEDSTEVIFMDDYAYENTVDTFLCEGSELVLQAPVPGRYQWSNGNVSSSIVVRQEGAYQLSVNNKCGRYRFTHHVSKRDCDCELVLPTAFSPNGDQRNDVLKVVDQCRYRNWRLGSFQVYDKWGGKVYQETGPTVSWNGLGTNSEELPPGVYTYRLIATIQEENGETPVIKTGSVHLLR